MTRFDARAQGAFLPVAVLALWEATGRAGMAPLYLSSPSQILGALWAFAIDGELARAMAVSLYRLILGFTLGAAAGAMVGLGAGMLPGIRHFFDPLVSFLYAVPKITIFPIFLLLFGLGHSSKIAIVALSVFFPVFVASRHAMLSVSPRLVWSARNMGASGSTIFRRVVIPASGPQLFAGLRIGLAHSFVVLFAAEIIASDVGIGVLITDGEDAARFDMMFAGILVFALLGFLGDRILMAVRRRVLYGQLVGTEEAAR